MKIKINPLSINQAYTGRRFGTDAYKQLQKDMQRLIGYSKKEPLEGEIHIDYVFYIKNYAKTDVFNFEKCFTDTLVKLGYIVDDRYIKSGTVRKEKVENYYDESVEINIRAI